MEKNRLEKIKYTLGGLGRLGLLVFPLILSGCREQLSPSCTPYDPATVLPVDRWVVDPNSLSYKTDFYSLGPVSITHFNSTTGESCPAKVRGPSYRKNDCSDRLKTAGNPKWQQIEGNETRLTACAIGQNVKDSIPDLDEAAKARIDSLMQTAFAADDEEVNKGCSKRPGAIGSVAGCYIAETTNESKITNVSLFRTGIRSGPGPFLHELLGHGMVDKDKPLKIQIGEDTVSWSGINMEYGQTNPTDISEYLASLISTLAYYRINDISQVDISNPAYISPYFDKSNKEAIETFYLIIGNMMNSKLDGPFMNAVNGGDLILAMSIIDYSLWQTDQNIDPVRGWQFFLQQANELVR